MATTLCNNTKSLAFFHEAARTVAYFLYIKDASVLNDLSFTEKSEANKTYLLSLAQKFDSVFKKYNLKSIPGGLNKKISISNGLWHEKNFFYYDMKNKKPVQIMQLVILFEGNYAEIEKTNPRIKEVKLRLGKAIINRNSYLLNQKPIDSPPLLEPAN